jgi:thiol-disulfide isomerase/thioredoxin
MKTLKMKWMLALLALAATTSMVLADEPTLKVGAPAPKLVTGKWVQGDQVKEFEKGKAYIVEFWATWCGPCKVSIPHLNETAKKYKDKGLIVIGQDCWEQDDGKVAPFVKTMGDKMTYCVALDDKDGSEKGKMAETWMVAAGRNGIPSAFLVDTTGKIAWIGHPMQLKEQVIEDVLAGKYDLTKAAADSDEEGKDQAKLAKVAADLGKAMKNKDWDAATTQLDAIEKLLPGDQKGNLDMARMTVSFGKKDYPAAYKTAMKISDAHKDDAMVQNQLAWQIVSDDTIEKRDLGVAETIAKRANDASEGKNPAIMDTLARVYFMQDKKTEAIALEKKAVKLADDDMKDGLQKTLDSYKKGDLPKAE